MEPIVSKRPGNKVGSSLMWKQDNPCNTGLTASLFMLGMKGKYLTYQNYFRPSSRSSCRSDKSDRPSSRQGRTKQPVLGVGTLGYQPQASGLFDEDPGKREFLCAVNFTSSISSRILLRKLRWWFVWRIFPQSSCFSQSLATRAFGKYKFGLGQKLLTFSDKHWKANERQAERTQFVYRQN